jgi:8'-apo-carotenoid 13,14-cleaving dioxygenase
MTMLDDRSAGATGNIYLDGNYGPVADEVTTFDLAVIGELPEDLNGRYLRNGPNPFDVPDVSNHHWFVGDGMVHGIRLRDGRAEWYRNRYVGSTRTAQRAGHDDIDGPNWSRTPVGANTNVGGFAGTTWAMVEAGGSPVELTYELETICRNDFSGTLPGAFSAHPKLDPLTGELHAMTYSPNWMNPDLTATTQYVIVAPDGRVRRTVDIPLGALVMVHDMALTQRYAVVYDMPVTFNMDLLAKGRPLPMRWNPDYGARLGLLPRRVTEADGSEREGEASDTVWIDVPISYVYHPLNAYDQADGSVVIDHCVYDTMFDGDTLGPFGDGLPRLERWVVNPVARTCSVSIVSDRANEFPRHRGALSTLQHRYGYCAQPSYAAGDAWPTLKHDLQRGTTEVFDHGIGRCAGEPVFVGRPGSAERGPDAEDDGWLVTYVHDLREGTAEFVVIDAQDFGRGYVARVPLPQRVPFGFHGNWVSDRSMGIS